MASPVPLCDVVQVSSACSPPWVIWVRLPSEPELVWGAQRQAVRDELGWTGKSDAYDAILVRLQPVALAVWQWACAVDGETPPAVAPELEAFETWFEGAHGKSFYALFDQYVPEVPVVDF